MWRQALGFGLIGVINTCVDVLIFSGLIHQPLGLNPVFANVISYGCGLLCSYVLNSVWTFKVRAGEDAARRFGTYAAISLSSLAGSTLIIAIVAPPTSPLAAKLLSLPATYMWNFLLSRKLVFRSA